MFGLNTTGDVIIGALVLVSQVPKVYDWIKKHPKMYNAKHITSAKEEIAMFRAALEMRYKCGVRINVWQFTNTVNSIDLKFSFKIGRIIIQSFSDMFAPIPKEYACLNVEDYDIFINEIAEVEKYLITETSKLTDMNRADVCEK